MTYHLESKRGLIVRGDGLLQKLNLKRWLFREWSFTGRGEGVIITSTIGFVSNISLNDNFHGPHPRVTHCMSCYPSRCALMIGPHTRLRESDDLVISRSKLHGKKPPFCLDARANYA